MVRDQTGWMLDMLGDPAQTGVVIVAAPEEMPVNETLELADRLAEETVVDLAAVVVNRVLPELFGRGEEEVFDQLVLRRQRGAPQRGARHVGPPDPRRRPARGHPAPHPRRPPHPVARGAARRHAAALRAVPLPAQPRCRATRQVAATSPRSSASDGLRHRSGARPTGAGATSHSVGGAALASEGSGRSLAPCPRHGGRC